MRKAKIDTKAAPLSQRLEEIVGTAYRDCGYDPSFARVIRSKIPELADYQSNGAFAAAKDAGIPPMEAARKIVEKLKEYPEFKSVAAVQPGFVNMFLSDGFVRSLVEEMFSDETLSVPGSASPKKVIIDFGGANVAKPLHVGHLRSAIIGESIKRIGRFLGHEVIGDVHLGDWGLQMGMVISELRRRQPDLPYFDENFSGPYPEESPVTVADLDEIYPEASRKAKEEAAAMEAARSATVELQSGRPGYRALWKKIVEVSIADLKKDYGNLGVEFDLWLGESDANDVANQLIDELISQGKAFESQGACIMEVGAPEDPKPLPPLMLKNSEGGVLYGGTDLATIKQRVEAYDPDEIIYVVDKRQSLHLEQVFRGARIAGLAGDQLKFEHIDFGTMNGSDNKPFKTRAGGTMKLKELIAMIVSSAKERLKAIEEPVDGFDEDEVARKVGVATLKFADLSNYRASDYIFDVERFSSFEGRTGPYLLYSIARVNSLLEKARQRAIAAGERVEPTSETERDILMKLIELPQAIEDAWKEKSPKLICDFAYDIAALFSRFYHECPVLAEKDPKIAGSRLLMAEMVRDSLVLALDLLGIESVDRM